MSDHKPTIVKVHFHICKGQSGKAFKFSIALMAVFQVDGDNTVCAAGEAAADLTTGKIVAVPTDTIYGVACLVQVYFLHSEIIRQGWELLAHFFRQKESFLDF